MYYTIGHKENYDKGLAEHKKLGEPFKKAGRRADYIGGILFPSVSDAEVYLRNNNVSKRFAVYGVKALQHQTYVHEETKTLHLTEDAEIVHLDEIIEE